MRTVSEFNAERVEAKVAKEREHAEKIAAMEAAPAPPLMRDAQAREYARSLVRNQLAGYWSTLACDHCGTEVWVDGQTLLTDQWKVWCPGCGWVSSISAT